MVVRLSALSCLPPPPQGRFLDPFLLGAVNPRAIVQLQGLGKLKKNTMPLSGFELMTFVNSSITFVLND
jgi:hypothetical protein